MSHQLSAKTVFTHPIHFIATGFGSGLLPWFPGTWGTLVAIPLYYLFQHASLMIYSLIILISFTAGCWICDVSARAFKTPDPGAIVWDEIVGYWITMFLAPPGWLWIVMGFVLFRFFDIVKPWPIGYLDQRLKNGVGIMLDDVVAGIYACCVLQLITIIR